MEEQTESTLSKWDGLVTSLHFLILSHRNLLFFAERPDKREGFTHSTDELVRNDLHGKESCIFQNEFLDASLRKLVTKAGSLARSFSSVLVADSELSRLPVGQWTLRSHRERFDEYADAIKQLEAAELELLERAQTPKPHQHEFNTSPHGNNQKLGSRISVRQSDGTSKQVSRSEFDELLTQFEVASDQHFEQLIKKPLRAMVPDEWPLPSTAIMTKTLSWLQTKVMDRNRHQEPVAVFDRDGRVENPTPSVYVSADELHHFLLTLDAIPNHVVAECFKRSWLFEVQRIFAHDVQGYFYAVSWSVLSATTESVDGQQLVSENVVKTRDDELETRDSLASSIKLPKRPLSQGDNPQQQDTPARPAVELGGEGKPVFVNGVEKKALTPVRYTIVSALVNAFPNRLAGERFVTAAGGKVDAVSTLRDLRDSDADWKAALLFPGKGNYGMGYGIAPRT